MYYYYLKFAADALSNSSVKEMCRRQILAVHNYSLCMSSFCIRKSLYLPLFWRESNNRCNIIFRYMAMGYWRLSRGRKWKKVHAQGHFGLLWFPYAVALGWKKHEVFPLGHPHMPLHKGLKIRYLMPHTAQIAWRLYSHATDGKKIFHQSGSLCLAEVMLPLPAPAVRSITVYSHWLKEKK